MAPAPASVLAINGGSSSIKFAVYRAGTVPTLSLSGTLDRIGRSGTTLSWRAKEGASVEGHTEVPDVTPAPRLLIDWLEARQEFAGVSAVGHRVVHGMTHSEPERVTPDVLDELRRATPYAPDHLPREIELIEAFRDRHPHLTQVACFDTAFHGMMPASPGCCRSLGAIKQKAFNDTASTACLTPTSSKS
jgi:acetate kinase